MTHEEAIIELTRIFREYPALLSIDRVEPATLPNVPSNAIVLEVIVREITCT